MQAEGNGMHCSMVGELILCLMLACGCNLCSAIRIEKSAYHDIIIDISQAVPTNSCNTVLENLETTLRTASGYLFSALDGRAYFGSVIINLPNSWPDSCVPDTNSLPSPSQGGKSDFTLTTTNLLYGDKIWTQQSGGCGVGGDQIYIPYESLEDRHAGKKFVKEWAKYRYGIFDEIGYIDDNIYPQCYFTDSMHVTGCSDGVIRDLGLCSNPNPDPDLIKIVNKTARSSLMFVPQADGVTMFCDEGTHNRYAPTKHNLLCGRKSTLEVVLRHKDFASSNLATVSSTVIKNTNPEFLYRRRVLTRYVMVIDETQEILLRESWSFLRNAIRKWVVHDLRPNCELGIVLAGGTATNKILPITNLNAPKNRDLVASFVPYSPSDSRQTACISCAVRTSFDMLEDRRKNQDNASHVVVVLAPGMDFATDYLGLAKTAVAVSAKIVTINFPSIVRRQPLDKLALHSAGLAFTIYEKKYNSEKSYLDTYFQLAEALFHISQEYYEGPAYQKTVEIHRKELVDLSSEFTLKSKRASRIVQGTFFLDGHMGNPSGFFIYTHNAEIPLIQNVRLISPKGTIYNTRSDRRMPVKQLTLQASINEIGAWAYMIERFNGNPQPHFVQVMATPENEGANFVRARAWLTALQAAGPFIIYCEVKRGEYPVHSAYVQVTISRPAVPCNYSICEENFKLLDTGSGDPDITKGDGIYSRYLKINTGPGTYRVDIFADDNGNTAFSMLANAGVQNIPCCGSFVSTKETRQIVPFQRYLPPLTFHLTQEDIDAMIYIPLGRIGDLVIGFLSEGQVRLTWTTPDMGGEGVARYEIKFAFTIEDIVDRFETAAIMWNHDNPYPYDVGEICNFNLDINLEPRLFGQAVYFAVRPYAKLATNAIAGPVSNPVRTFIPNKIQPTLPPPTVPAVTTRFIPKDDDDDIPSDSSINNYDIDLRVMYSIPIVVAALCIITLIVIFNFGCIYRRRERIREVEDQVTEQSGTKQDGSSNELQEDNLNSVSASNHNSARNTPNSSPNHATANELATKHTSSLKHNYATLGAPDHHTVGIPVYKNHEDLQNKRHSTSGSFNGITQITSYEYLIDEIKARSAELNSVPGYIAANISGLSIISNQSENATLPRPGAVRPVLSPYGSWTASQFLHEHDRHSPPVDEIINQANLKYSLPTAKQISNSIDEMSLNGCGAPPVPPLPYAPDIYEQFQYPYVYGTMPKQHHEPFAANYTKIARVPSEQQQQQQQPPMLYNNPPMLSGRVCNGSSNSGGDKNRRNITMV